MLRLAFNLIILPMGLSACEYVFVFMGVSGKKYLLMARQSIWLSKQ